MRGGVSGDVDLILKLIAVCRPTGTAHWFQAVQINTIRSASRTGKSSERATQLSDTWSLQVRR